jgi:D-alanyl-lipoteichoic acid acyltransferase DltB (MBOAT superfamily)
MLFHTWIFIAFFLIVYPVYLLIRRSNRAMVLWLLAASYAFYGWWNWWYLILIVVTTTLDWFIGLRLGRAGARKKAWLILSLMSNLGLLAFFKYADFFTENLNLLLSHFGYAAHNPMRLLIDSINASFPAADIKYILPVGISFFTFQSMSYTIDVYRGLIPVERNLLRFAAFVSLFPQLVAGPIERASNLLPQLHGVRTITRDDITQGLSHCLVGFFKKVALADYMALYADQVYGRVHEAVLAGRPDLAPQGAALALGTFAFAWQIYFDFSGYTDMARGIAQMMGFRLMLNFNNPYTATGLGDFWSRWHISLSTWFKDYVYVPLGGNRGSTLQTYRNMFLTMIISGFWHGAAWTFIIWGALHAVGRVLTRELERAPFYLNHVPRLAKQIGVFVFVCFTWVFFRAQSVEEAMLVLTRLFDTSWIDPKVPLMLVVLALAVWCYQFFYASGRVTRWLVELPAVRLALAWAMIAYLMVFAQPSTQAFIYFQF